MGAQRCRESQHLRNLRVLALLLLLLAGGPAAAADTTQPASQPAAADTTQPASQPAAADTTQPASQPAAADTTQPAPPDEASQGRALGTLEAERIALAMTRRGLEAEVAPEGLRICHIVAVREEVFVEEGVLPLWPNRLRVHTSEAAVRNALRFGEGDAWDEELLRDSERRLRTRGVFAYVAMVPFRMEEAGCVGVLVLTRDIWSLRPGFSVATSGATLTTLYLGVEEINLLGTNALFAVDVFRRLGDVRAGPRLRVPQLAASDLRLTADGDLQFERGGQGRLEGGRTSLILEKPLLDARTRRGWALTLAWSDLIERRFQGSELREVEVVTEDERAAIPERWQSVSAVGEGVAAWGWGGRWRHELEAGPRVTLRQRRALAAEEERFSPALLEAFRAERLGRDERGVGPVLRWRFFESRYRWYTNLERFAIGEELRTGPTLAAELRWSDPALGASGRWVTQGVSAAWTLPLGEDAWLRASAGVSLRMEEGWGDLRRDFALRAVGPRVSAGRFIARASASLVTRDTRGTTLEAGSDTGLRGHPNGALVGRDLTRLNLEWRSLPLQIAGAYLGGVVFADAAAVRSAEERWQGAAGTGVGLRLLIPQVNALVQRIDLGFPLQEDAARIGASRVPRPLVSIGLEQAF